VDKDAIFFPGVFTSGAITVNIANAYWNKNSRGMYERTN
jgi:hypothetical protein